MYHPMDKTLTIIGPPLNKPIISVCKLILKSLNFLIQRNKKHLSDILALALPH